MVEATVQIWWKEEMRKLNVFFFIISIEFDKYILGKHIIIVVTQNKTDISTIDEQTMEKSWK